QADRRFPAQVLAELAGVGEGVALIARAGRRLPGPGAPAGNDFEVAQDVPDGGRLAATDVVNLTGLSVYGGDRRAHAIADVGVAAHLLAIAADRDRLVVEHGL